MEENEEEDQVLRKERADHAGLEHEDEDEEGLRVPWLGEVVPGVDDAQRHDEDREQQQRKRDAVETDDVAAVDDLDPPLVLDELQAPGVAVVEVRGDAERRGEDEQ